MSLLPRILPAALLALHVLSAQGADQVTYYREGQRIDPREVAEVLARPTRSIRLLVEQGAAPAAARVQAATAADGGQAERLPRLPRERVTVAAAAEQDHDAVESAALAVQVRFAFDSADIQPSALPQLDAVAQGIAMLPAGQAVIVEGHTDARGTAAYNLDLSRRRAEAVKRYLVAAHGIDPARLRTTGHGFDRPLPGSDPAAAQNRRVQFRGSTPQQADGAQVAGR